MGVCTVTRKLAWKTNLSSVALQWDVGAGWTTVHRRLSAAKTQKLGPSAANSHRHMLRRLPLRRWKKSRTGNSAHPRPAVITYLQTASSTTPSGLARSDCRVQTATNRRRPHTSTVPFAMLQCRSLVTGKSIIIYSVGRIDRPNRFESIRSAESIWLIIDSVVTYYYTIHYTIHNLLNSSNKRACSNRFVNVTI